METQVDNRVPTLIPSPGEAHTGLLLTVASEVAASLLCLCHTNTGQDAGDIPKMPSAHGHVLLSHQEK